MGALPKRRISRRRQGRRRRNQKSKLPTLVRCQHCGKEKHAHSQCPSCGK